MVEDSSSSGEEDTVIKSSNVSAKMTAYTGNKEMMAEVASLRKQMEDIQVEMLDKHLAAMNAIKEVKILGFPDPDLL
jgi:uncharacterized membrane protein (DUF106 family)